MAGRRGGQLELVWARGPGYAEVALVGWLEGLDPAPTPLSSWKGTNNWQLLVSLTPEQFPAIPCPFDEHFRISKWISFTYSLIAL